MQLSCEVCHAPLRPEDVRLDIAVAKCHSCNAVYDLSGRKARGLPASSQARPKLTRAKAPLPSKFKVEDDGGATRITWRWFNPLQHIFMLFFCIAWDGFLVMWYGIAFAAGGPLIMKIFPLVHVAVGVGLTYSTITGFLNRTTVEVSRTRLTIRHGPLPWVGNRDVPGRQFTQLYGEETAKTNKGSTTYTYDLIALDREGRKIKLLSGLTEKDQVLYLEQTLERRLGIEDEPVAGEVAARTSAA
jgi:hypothetical protein